MHETIENLFASINRNEKLVDSIEKNSWRTHQLFSMENISRLPFPQNSFIKDTLGSRNPIMNMQTAPFLSMVNGGRKFSIAGDILSNKYNNNVSNDRLKYLSTIGHEANFVLVQLIEENEEEEFHGVSLTNELKLRFSRSTYVSAIKFPMANDIQGCGMVHVLKEIKEFCRGYVRLIISIDMANLCLTVSICIHFATNMVIATNRESNWKNTRYNEDEAQASTKTRD